MAERFIKIVNKDKVSLTVNEYDWEPFLLAKAAGIYDTENTIYVANNTLVDGAEYQGSVTNAKNIVLVLKEKNPDKFAENRDLINTIFDRGSLGILTVYEDDHERQIEFYTESITTTATPKVRLTSISLVCPTAFFTDTFDSIIHISNVMPNFEWEHEFFEKGEEFSYYNLNRIKVIENNTAENNIGLTIMITCTASVVNPSVTKVETGETLKIGDENNPFTLHAGERLLISTVTGKKNVQLVKNGVTQDINQYLTDASSFFQLTRGQNSFGYDADENPDYITVTMTYRYKYQRA